jgi:hypothetical protein
MVSRRCPGSARTGAELFARNFGVSFADGSGHAASISAVWGAARGGLLDFFGRGGGFGGTDGRITQIAADDSQEPGGSSFWVAALGRPLPSTVPRAPGPCAVGLFRLRG